MKSKKLVTVSILAIFIVIIMPPSSFAAAINSNWATTAVIIDGAAFNGEWDDAYNNTIILRQAYTPTNTLTITLLAKNNISHLYLCLKLPDVSGFTLPYDMLWVCFDENNDGDFYDFNENDFVTKMNSSGFFWWDAHMTGVSPNMTETTQDGLAAGTHDGSMYVVECKIPLSSSDPQDMQPGAGSLIGIAVLFWTPLGEPQFEYPSYAMMSYAAASFQLASAPGDGGIGTPVSFVFLLASIILVAIAFILKKSKREPSLNW